MADTTPKPPDAAKPAADPKPAAAPKRKYCEQIEVLNNREQEVLTEEHLALFASVKVADQPGLLKQISNSESADPDTITFVKPASVLKSLIEKSTSAAE
jgi:hypothetical protein